jgi:ribosomal protein S18 acetylase RimI-like enzyme
VGEEGSAPSLRAAEARDRDSLSAFAVETYTDAFGDSFSPEDLNAQVESQLSSSAFERILATDVVLLAESSGRLVGFVQVGFAPGDAGLQNDAEVELRRLYVHRRAQDRGIGSQLMNAALAHPRLAGVRRISLDVWDRNEGALRFYRRHGFRAVGEQQFVVASGAETTPDIIMVRDLRSSA